MAGQNSTEERESIFEKLAKKLEQTGNGSGNSAPEQPKMNGLDTSGAVGAPTGQNDVEKEERPRPISGANLFTVFEMNRKRKTAAIEVPKTTIAPAEAQPEKKISDFNWNPPFHIYGRMLRKEGAGFGSENIIPYFIKLDSVQADLEDLAAKAEEIKQVIQEGSEAAIEYNYANKTISEIEKILELEKLSKKREAFLHYTGICYVALWMAEHRSSLQSEKQSPEKEKENRQCFQSMYSLLLEIAKHSFVKHNRDPAKPKDKDSTTEEGLANKDATRREDLERMCCENGPVYDVFHQTIIELAGLFVKQFSEMYPENVRSYHNLLHSNNMKNFLASLGSTDLTTPLWQIESLSGF